MSSDGARALLPREAGSSERLGDAVGLFSTTEPWVALRDGLDFVIALYVRGKYSNWQVGANENSHFMQAWTSLYLAPGETTTVTAYLVVGRSISDVRNRIYAMEGY